jgi:surface protein
MTFSIRTAAIAAMLASAPTLATANTFVVPLGEDVATGGMTDDSACETTPIGETCEATIDGRSETLLVVDDSSIRTAVAGGIEVDGVTYAPGLPNGLYTGNVTDMTGLFYGQHEFNTDIGHWETGAVKSMRAMFAGAWSDVRDHDLLMQFNRDISAWDVSSVQDMSYMFRNNDQFNQPIGQWDTQSLVTTAHMFHYAKGFDQSLNDWDVSDVVDISYMFRWATEFDQPLNRWDVSQVQNMNNTFRLARGFDQDIIGWDVRNVRNMTEMFLHASDFTTDLSGWCVPNLSDTPSRFSIASDRQPQWGNCNE